MLRKILVVLMVIMPLMAIAQESENKGGMVIRLDTVRFSDTDQLKMAEQYPLLKNLFSETCDKVNQLVWNAVKQSRRFTITDKATAEKKQALMESEMAMDLKKDDLKKMKQKNAEDLIASYWAMDVDITKLKFTTRNLGGAKAYDAYITIAITIKDNMPPYNVISTETFTSAPVVGVHKLKQIDAVELAVESLEGLTREKGKVTLNAGGLAYYFTNQFDTRAMGEGMEGDLYKICAGENQGVNAKTTFKLVYRSFDPAKKTFSETPFGECSVESVTPTTCLCKITKGKKELGEYSMKGEGDIMAISMLKSVIKEIKLKE